MVTSPRDSPNPAPATPRTIAPLYAAGLVTAFGAHSIAANLGAYTHDEHASLLALGVLLAVYDGAEVVLKPVFGALTDRIGPRPVLLGGLIAFAVFSAAFVLAGNPALVGLARLGQGAAAAAFSPAAGTLVARLAPPKRQGRAFGGYGMWKSFGYAGGPLLGGALITVGGFTTLFATLAVLALAVAVWAAVAVPATAPLPRPRQTVADLARRLGSRSFLIPTLCLAATTAALSVGVGFLPVRGAAAGLNPLETGVAVSLLAAATALVQPFAGRARDAAHLRDRSGMTGGLLLAAAGLAMAALLPGLAGLLASGLVIGVGIGVATPLGFAALAANSPQERLGQTMGAAEVGRELGDAGGPLLVAGLATAATLSGGLLGLAVLLAAAGAAIGRTRPSTRPAATPPGAETGKRPTAPDGL
jgi:MFS family permease